MTQPLVAVFLDRDGTLILDRHYLADPAGVELLPGAGEAVARLNRAGVAVVLASNQSGIGRGYFTEADYHAVQQRLLEVLAEHGAGVDGAYFAPGVEDGDPDADRKPGAGMFLRAARDLGLELARCAWVGDRVRDVLAAARFGGRAVLVRSPHTELDRAAERGITVVDSLAAAVDLLLGEASAGAARGGSGVGTP